MSAIVWRWLRKARDAGHRLDEETITDLVCLEFRHRFRFEIETFPTTKREESRTGADWEWRFMDLAGRSHLVMRIQAKILDPRTQRFEYLHSKDGAQTKALIKHCEWSSKPDASGRSTLHVPLYCLFAEWDMAKDPPGMDVLKPPRGATCGGRRRRRSDWACTLLPAKEVLEMGSKRELSLVLPMAIPMHELFCGSSRKKGLAHRVAKNLVKFRLGSEDLVAKVAKKPSSFVPEYVRGALATMDMDDKDSPWPELNRAIADADPNHVGTRATEAGDSARVPSRVTIFLDASDGARFKGARGG